MPRHESQFTGYGVVWQSLSQGRYLLNCIFVETETNLPLDAPVRIIVLDAISIIYHAETSVLLPYQILRLLSPVFRFGKFTLSMCLLETCPLKF